MSTDVTKAEVVVSDASKKAPLTILDGLSNLATGLGGGKDKAQHNVWNHSGKNFDHVALSARFREDWISQKIIKIVPQDMTREWRHFESEKARAADKEMNVSALFKEAYQWARLYGTSFIILDVNDGRPIDKPVRWNKLKQGCIKNMWVVDRTRITTIGEIEQSPMSPDFGMPVQYQFVNSQTPIHKDRIIRFEGTELPIYERQRNLWYSDSTLIPLMPQIDNFHTSSFAAAQMVQEANTDIIKVDGLSNILATDTGTAAMLQRFTEWKQIKSVFGVSILDATEEYESKSIQLSGVKDLIWEYLKIVAASVGIPATRFLSASPDGMNATGESDQINYVEFLQGLQKDIFDRRVNVVDRLMSVHYDIPITEFEYKWKCIFPESATQKQEREKTESEKLKILTEAGIISRESALAEAKLSGLVSMSATVGDNPNPPTPTIGASNAN
jgi:phage-related protein (TIGR01555 family)